jgi:hypothetical protein
VIPDLRRLYGIYKVPETGCSPAGVAARRRPHEPRGPQDHREAI